MIVVHVNKFWPLVEDGRMTKETAVLQKWPISPENLKKYGDVLAAVYDNTVVAVFDIDRENSTRDSDHKVTFAGAESRTWAHLVGQPNPGKHWGRQGDAWPVRYVDTAVVAGGDVPVQQTDHGRRAVIDEVVMAVAEDGHVTVVVPAGRTVTVRTLAKS